MREASSFTHEPIKTPLTVKTGATILACFLSLLVLLPVAASRIESHGLKLFDSFFRAGSLVFGGAHVVPPLLKAEVVNPGWVSSDASMAGYGAAQAIPGPLFTISAYLGAVSKIPPAGCLGALICLVAAFLPSFLLLLGALPFLEKQRRIEAARFAMQGINAAVVVRRDIWCRRRRLLALMFPLADISTFAIAIGVCKRGGHFGPLRLIV